MCDLCKETGRRLLAALPGEQQRLIRLALVDEAENDGFERGVEQGEDDQREDDESVYRRQIIPARDALLAAAMEAERDSHLDSAVVLTRLIASVRADTERIPLRLP